jgi:hypothetical protein
MGIDGIVGGFIMQPTGILETSKAAKNPLKELLNYGQSMARLHPARSFHQRKTEAIDR